MTWYTSKECFQFKLLHRNTFFYKNKTESIILKLNFIPFFINIYHTLLFFHRMETTAQALSF